MPPRAARRACLRRGPALRAGRAPQGYFLCGQKVPKEPQMGEGISFFLLPFETLILETTQERGRARPLPWIRPPKDEGREIRRRDTWVPPYERWGGLPHRCAHRFAMTGDGRDGGCGGRPQGSLPSLLPTTPARCRSHSLGNCLAAGKNVPPAVFYPARPYEKASGLPHRYKAHFRN